MTESEFRKLFEKSCGDGKKIWCDTVEEYCAAIEALEDMGYEIGEGSCSAFDEFPQIGMSGYDGCVRGWRRQKRIDCIEYQDFIEMYHAEFLGEHKEPETAEDQVEAEAMFLSVLTAME